MRWTRSSRGRQRRRLLGSWAAKRGKNEQSASLIASKTAIKVAGRPRQIKWSKMTKKADELIKGAVSGRIRPSKFEIFAKNRKITETKRLFFRILRGKTP